MKILVILLGAILVLWLVRPLAVLNQLLRQRMWKIRTRIAFEEEIPAWTRDGLRSPISELEALGFKLIGWLAVEREARAGDTPRLCARLAQLEARAQATVGFSTVPDSANPWTVTFSTSLTDGRIVRTLRGGERSILGEPPELIIVDPFAPTIQLQWEAHRAAVQTSGVIATDVDFDTSFSRSRDLHSTFFESRVSNRALLPVENSAYVLSWATALSALLPALRVTKRLAAQRGAQIKALQAALKPLPIIPIEEDVAAYHRHLANTSAPPRASFLLALFATSCLLFVATGALSMGAARTAAIVLGIVLFHELGHYLAMRAFGYLDTTIFFVPFLGGIATGKKDDATIAQRMAVLLAGPVPGLLLVIAFASLSHRASPHNLLLLVAAVNLFNLLPILPLDGGQIAHMLLFARRPSVDVVFRAVAGIGLLGIAIGTSGVFLGILGVLALTQLGNARRQALLRHQFAEARRQWPDVPAVTLFFQVLRTGSLATLGFGPKALLARVTLAHADEHSPQGWGRILGWLFAYGAAFAVGCTALVLSVGARNRPERRESIPVAALACPATADGAAADGGPSRPGRLAGVAAFDTPDLAEAARTRIAAAAQGAVLRAVGPALVVWIPRDDDDDVDDDQLSDKAKRIGALVHAAGGRFNEMAPFPTDALAVECTAPNDSAATAIAERLSDYVAGSASGMSIPAPWNEPNGPTEAQLLARRTVRLAFAARPTASEPSLPWWSMFTGKDRKGGRDYFRKLQAERARAAEAALVAERAVRPIDEEAARLLLSELTATSFEEGEEAREALLARLGGVSQQRRLSLLRELHSAKLSRSNSRLHVEVGYVSPQQVDEALKPMLSWLCVQQCSGQRLILDNQ